MTLSDRGRVKIFGQLSHAQPKRNRLSVATRSSSKRLSFRIHARDSDTSKCYSINRNQSRRVNWSRTISSSASGQQCAIGPRSMFRLVMILVNAFSLEKIESKSTQLVLTISPNSPNVVKSISSSDRRVTPPLQLLVVDSFSRFPESKVAHILTTKIPCERL